MQRLLAGLALAGGLLLVAQRLCSRGQLGRLRLRMEYCLATPEPLPGWLGLPAP